MSTISYQDAGVNIEAGNEAVRRIKKDVESTFSPKVLTSIGSFGALFDLQPIMTSYRHPVLVQSIDGVGTKMMIARMMQKFDTIGMDLVSATVNDIIVLGATPLTLLDYIANDQLNPSIIEAIIAGMAKSCREHDIALVGGETAEMPGTYLPGEHDLVGVVTGVVEKESVILGKDIKAGDAVIALPSSGLHTNGYSLARKLLFDVNHYQVNDVIADLNGSLGEVLLTPHLNYLLPVQHLLQSNIPIKGMAHITGGGLLENIPRVLPTDCAVEIKKDNWPVLPIFNFLCELGKLSEVEAYRTFNMGVGLVLILAKEAVEQVKKQLNDFGTIIYEIGEVVPGQRQVRLN